MRRFRLLEPWRSRVLWLSLALNVFLLALATPPLLWHGRGHGPRFEFIVERLAHGMPAADAARFRAVMDAERPRYEADRARVEAAKRGLAARLVAEPYDPAAAQAALEAMQARMEEAASQFNASMARAVGALSPGGRAQVAQFLNRAGPR